MTTQFLLELIENNTRVILPDFGAFLVKDDGSGVFKPDNITFSPFLRFNDGVLEDALIKSKKISKDEASKQINEFVEQIKSSLLNDGAFPLADYGHLYRDKRGSIHFATKEKAEALKQKTEEAAQPQEKLVGSESLLTISDDDLQTKETSVPEIVKDEANPIEKETKLTENEKLIEKPKQKPEPKTIKKPEKKTDIKTPEKKQEPILEKPKVQAPAKKTEAGAGKAILMGVLIGIAFIAIAVAGYYMYSKGYIGSNSNTADEQEILPVNTPDSIEKEAKSSNEPKSELEKEFEKAAPSEKPKQEALKPEIKKPASSKPAEATSDKKPVQPPVTVQTTTNGSFHVVVGSFRNAEYASKFSADMVKSGFNSRVIVRENGMHSVTLGSYQTREEANKALEQLRSQHPGAWILKQ